VQLEHHRRVLDPLAHLLVARLLQPEGERDVLVHAEVRVERVVLEHHRQVAVAGREVVDDLVADLDLALGDVLQPHDHPQDRRLPAARRADEDHELAVVDLQVDVGHRRRVRPGERLVDVLERDAGHVDPLPFR
jgi:hypothetical protein